MARNGTTTRTEPRPRAAAPAAIGLAELAAIVAEFDSDVGDDEEKIRRFVSELGIDEEAFVLVSIRMAVQQFLAAAKAGDQATAATAVFTFGFVFGRWLSARLPSVA